MTEEQGDDPLDKTILETDRARGITWVRNRRVVARAHLKGRAIDNDAEWAASNITIERRASSMR